MYVNVFSKMRFILIELGRIVSPRHLFYYLSSNHAVAAVTIYIPRNEKLAQQKKIQSYQKNKPTFYVLHNSLLIVLLILLYNKNDNQNKQVCLTAISKRQCFQ